MTIIATPVPGNDNVVNEDQITADPTNGSRPIPGYGHGSHKSYDAAVKAAIKQAEGIEAAAETSLQTIATIDDQLAELTDDRKWEVRRHKFLADQAKDLRNRIPKDNEA